MLTTVLLMMTSWNGNNCRLTGLCEGKASNVALMFSYDASQSVEKGVKVPLVWVTMWYIHHILQSCFITGAVTLFHYTDEIMGAMASQITSLTIVYSTVYSDTDQRKQQSSASLAFVRGVHRGPLNFPHKWPVTRKRFPFDDVIMFSEHNTARHVSVIPEMYFLKWQRLHICNIP